MWVQGAPLVGNGGTLSKSQVPDADPGTSLLTGGPF